MKQEHIERIQEIQNQQYKALAAQDMESLNVLESEKTQLLQQLPSFKDATDDQKRQLKSIFHTQQALEKVCIEVRDELGKQIKRVMDRHKAVSAYKDID